MCQTIAQKYIKPSLLKAEEKAEKRINDRK